MSDELKTLKDLELELYDNRCADCMPIIKKEAIKHRREIMKGFRYLKIDMNTMKALKTISKDAILKNNCIEKAVLFIDEFFNITEEDLNVQR